MTAYNQGLLSLYSREISREKELESKGLVPNQTVITTLENLIKEIQS